MQRKGNDLWFAGNPDNYNFTLDILEIYAVKTK